MEGEESGSSLTPMQLLGTDIHAYAPHPTSHSSLPCTNTQNLLLKISCLSAEQLLGLTQDGLKKREGIHSSKRTCRTGNSPVLVPLVDPMLLHYMGNTRYKVTKRSTAYDLIFILLQLHSKEIIIETQSHFYIRVIFAVIFSNNKKLEEQNCLKKESRSQ